MPWIVTVSRNNYSESDKINQAKFDNQCFRGNNVLGGQAIAIGLHVKITVGKSLASKDRLRDICTSKNDIKFIFRGYIYYTTN